MLAPVLPSYLAYAPALVLASMLAAVVLPVEILIPIVLLTDEMHIALLVSRADADVEVLVSVMVLRVELLLSVVLRSEVVLVPLPASRVVVDDQVLVPVAMLRVELLIPAGMRSDVVTICWSQSWCPVWSCWSGSWCVATCNSSCFLSHEWMLTPSCWSW